MKPLTPGFLLAFSVFCAFPAQADDCSDRAAPRAQRQSLKVTNTNHKISFRPGLTEEQRHVDDRLMTLMARMAIITNQSVLITSGFRSCKRNSEVRGAKKSAHLMGIAVDFQIAGFNSEELRMKCFQAGANAAGSYYDASGNFLPAAHCDFGNNRTWKYGPRK
jgi:uncharacterized protein YcbK (DUF882 family)